jgi:hypothetical protein
MASLLSLPAVHALVRMRPFADSGFLLYLGTFSFVIYLLNTLTIGLTKAVLFKFLGWDGVNFLVFFPILLAAGIFGPIAARLLIFRRVDLLERLTR